MDYIHGLFGNSSYAVSTGDELVSGFINLLLAV